MFIKRVTLEGFASYRHRTTFDSIDPGVNIIIGKNGSGKSNFYHALKFVLVMLKTRGLGAQHLRNERGLLQTAEAYVEIVFDNTCRTIPIDTDEVCIMRKINANTTQYYLNGRPVEMNYMQSLIEEIGLPVQNPSYIIGEGKTNRIATGTNEYRLTLLKDTSGLTRYETVRADVGRQIQFINKQDYIMQLAMERCDAHLVDLQRQAAHLREKALLEKRHRAVLYCIKQQSLNNYIEKYTQQVRAKEELVQLARPDINEMNTNLVICEEKLESISSHLLNAINAHEQLMAELQYNYDKQAEIQLCINAMESQIQDLERKQEKEEELRRVNLEIEETKKRLSDLRPQYDAAKATEGEFKIQLEAIIAEHEMLKAKQNCASTESKLRRDAQLQQELTMLHQSIADGEQRHQELIDQIRSDEVIIAELTEKLEIETGNVDQIRNNIAVFRSKEEEMKKHYSEQLDELRNDRRHEQEFQNVRNKLEEDKKKVENKLLSMVSMNTFLGCESMKTVMEHFKQQPSGSMITNAYYAVLADNFTCEKQYNTAVEAVAGNRLWYHIVQSQEVATRILQEFNRRKLPGVVTFIPLALDDARVKKPYRHEKKMLNVLQYEPKFNAAMNYIFGRRLLCDDIDDAEQYIKRYDCVTQNGVCLNTSGVVTAGFYDISKSIIENTMRRKAIETQLDENKVRQEKCSEEVCRIRTCNTQLLNTLHTTTTNLGDLQRQYKQTKDQIAQDERKLNVMKKLHASHVESQEAEAAQLQRMKAHVGSVDEARQNVTEDLTPDEIARMQAMPELIQNAQVALNEKMANRIHLEVDLNNVTHNLEAYLRVRRASLNSEIRDLHSQSQSQCNVNQLELKREELTTVEQNTTTIENQLRVNMSEKDRLERAQADSKRDIDNMHESIRSAIAEIHSVEQRLTETVRKISTLGEHVDQCKLELAQQLTVPAQILQEYQNFSNKQLNHKLEEINRGLRELPYINVTAYQMYLKLSALMDGIKVDITDVQTLTDATIRLVYHYDDLAVDVIPTAFAALKFSFEATFMQLVPRGQAELSLIADDEESIPLNSQGITEARNYAGIGIKAAFCSDHRPKNLIEMSGGQKAILAVAYVFALRDIEPLPFYFLDEVDVALDSCYRGNLAALVRNCARTAQFIITTFRPELITIAEKIFGVQNRNDSSTVSVITAEHAQQYISKF